MTVEAPKEEMTLMTYRVFGGFQLPFSVEYALRKVNDFKYELGLCLKCNFPEDISATKLKIVIPLPKSTATATAEFAPLVLNQQNKYGGIGSSLLNSVNPLLEKVSSVIPSQTQIGVLTDNFINNLITKNTSLFKQKQRAFVWRINKISGQAEQSCKILITLDSALNGDPKRQIGPIGMQFELPLSLSNIKLAKCNLDKTDGK